MTAITCGHNGSKCCTCGDPIYKGDPVLFAPDDAGLVHAECEVDPRPWTPSPSMHLRNLLATRGELAWHILQTDLDPDSLPPLVAEKFWEVVAAETELLSLLDDVASEHVVERT